MSGDRPENLEEEQMQTFQQNFSEILFTDGHIKVFIDYKKEPLAEASDSNPLPIKYFGFASYDNTLNKYFYNCDGENAYGEQDIKELCKFYEVYENEYKTFFPIADVTNIRSKGYIINFPFYIQAGRDAHVLLTTRPVDDRNDDCYEICKLFLSRTQLLLPNHFRFRLNFWLQ